jgi:dihydrofolate reductase
MIYIIVAVAENGVIGKSNQLLWKLPAELKFFKETTTGHSIIMGRKTFESIGRPLPNRRNIVVTRQTDFAPEGIEMAHSLEEALGMVPVEEEAFVIGGAELYKQALPLVQRVYFTRVHNSFEGDVSFPELGPEWHEISRKEGIVDEKNVYPHTFLVLEKTP